MNEDYEECEGCGEELIEEDEIDRCFCNNCYDLGGGIFGERDFDNIEFANPGSALRAETSNNPRNIPCPTCGEPNKLTPKDRELGYQCDNCADIAEGKNVY